MAQSALLKLISVLGLDDFRYQNMSQTISVLHSLIEMTPLAFVYQKGHVSYMEYNDAFSALFQIPFVAAELQMSHVLSRYPKVLDLFQNTLLEGCEYRSRLMYFEREDRLLHLLVDARQVRAEGEILGWLFSCRDIDSFASLEADILRNNRLVTIGKIAAGIAHEIRNPLTSILGFLQLLQQDWQGQGRNREKEFVDVILMEIDRVKQLVNQLLLLSKPVQMVPDVHDLNELVENVGLLYESDALLRKVAIGYRLASIPPVKVDQNMLKQVLFNLIRNALDAMEDGGELLLSTRFDESENKVRVDVADTGPGIPPYLADRIFEAFFTTKEQGTGLGLAICQRIVHEFGGTIRFNSKGYGTTFSVLLPPYLREESL